MACRRTPFRYPRPVASESSPEPARPDTGRFSRPAPATFAVTLLAVAALAVVAVVSGIRSGRNLQRAEDAERIARERLAEAYLEKGRALRASPRMGARNEALEALRQSAAIGPTGTLRQEAIATLALPDLEEERFLPTPDGAGLLAINAGLDRVAVVETNGSLSIRDAASDQVLARCPLPEQPWHRVRSVSFSPSGKLVLAALGGGGAAVWDAATARLLFTNAIAPGVVQGGSLFLAADERSAFLYDPLRSDRLQWVEIHSGRRETLPIPLADLRAIRTSPDGRQLALARGRDLEWWETGTWKELGRLSHDSFVTLVAWRPGLPGIAVGCVDGSVVIWDVDNRRPRQLTGHAAAVTTLAFSPDGQLLASSAADGTSHLWEVASGRLLRTMENAQVTRFDPSGTRIGFLRPGSGHGVWRFRPGTGHRVLRSVHGRAGFGAKEELSPDGRWLAWSKGDGILVVDLSGQNPPEWHPMNHVTAVFWHPLEHGLFVLQAGQIHFRRFEASHPGRFLPLGTDDRMAFGEGRVTLNGAVSPDGQVLALVHLGGEILLVDLPRRQVISRVPGEANPTGPLSCGSLTGSGRMALSPDGRWLATCDMADHPAPHVWEVASGRLVHRLPDGAAGVAFSPDGRWLGAVSKTGAMVCRVGTWEEVWRRPRTAASPLEGSLAFSGDGTRLVISRSAHEVELLDPASGASRAVFTAPEVPTILGLRLDADASRLVVLSGNDSVHVWDLPALRQALAPLGLDWETGDPAPPGPPAGPRRLSWDSPAGVTTLGLVAALVAAGSAILILQREQRLASKLAQTDTLARRREQELRVERELVRLKTSFVSMVSHEFRTPLGVIQSSADLLRSYYERLRPEQRREQLDDIILSVERMAGLMEEVLLLGRVESGRIQYQPVPVDLVALCRRTIDQASTAAHDRCPVELVNEGLSAGDLVQVDESLVAIILGNLLSNALKYSPAGALVTVGLRRGPEGVVLEVRDRGIGIPAADRAELFKAFHRAGNVGGIPGSGLGLTIVNRCVDLHRGRIAFRSSEGTGTVFTVTLPAGPAA